MASRRKRAGSERPLTAHRHWRTDVSYIAISGTFYYLCSMLDGFSRYTVNSGLRESMSIRPGSHLSDARPMVSGYVDHCNSVKPEQRDGLRHAERHACWAAAGDPRGA